MHGQPESPEHPPQPAGDRVAWCFLGGIIGAALVLLIKGWNINSRAGGMEYEDLAAILLSAVGVIVTVFGAVLAILAFWGFSQLKKESVKAAVTTARRQVDQIIKEEIKSPEMEKRIRDRVDEIVLGSSQKDKELDSDPENDGDLDA